MSEIVHVPSQQFSSTLEPGLSQSGLEYEIPAKQLLVLKSPLDCNVMFAKSPGEFYYQLNPEHEAMITLMDSMYEFYAEKDI